VRTPRGAPVGDRPRDLRGTGQRGCAVVGQLLHQLDAVGLLRVVLVAGEQPPHRVAPAGLARQADRRPAEGVDAAADLVLGEAGVARGDPDVGGQQQLDAPALRAARAAGRRRGLLTPAVDLAHGLPGTPRGGAARAT
jgi:hypothetical protein